MSLFGNQEDNYLNPPDDDVIEPRTTPRFRCLRAVPIPCITKGCLDVAERGKLRCWDCSQDHADKMDSYMEGE